MSKLTGQHPFLVLAVCAAIASPAAAAVFTDGFGDGDYNNDATLDGPVDSALDTGFTWYRARSGATSAGQVMAVSVVNDDGAGLLNGGNAMSVVANSTSPRYMLFNFPNTADLANVGDYLSISFDVRITTSPLPNLDQAFRFGFYNHGGTPLTADFQGNAADDAVNPGDLRMGDDFGVHAQMDVRDPSSVQANNASVRWEDPGDTMLGGTTLSWGASTNNIAAVLNASKKTVSLTITRVADPNDANNTNHMLVVLNVDGTDVISRATYTQMPGFVTLPGVPFTFHEFVVSTSTNFDYRIDNVTLDSNVVIPEPASLGLLALGGLLVSRRRR